VPVLPGDRPAPALLLLLTRLLIHGEQAPFIRADLEESFGRDLSAGVTRGRAIRRFAVNLTASTLSVWWSALTGLFTHGAVLDAKLGIRMLGRQPLLTGVAMLALALGIPASLSMNHVLTSLFSPLPVPEGERVIGIRNWSREVFHPVASSVHDFALWRESLVSFESVAAARSRLVNLSTGDPGAPPVRGAEVSASAFGLLRAAPILGRVYGPEDEVRGGPDVVIISEDTWASRLARDPEIIGKTVRIASREHTVVGVMPASFRFPLDDDLWLPLRASPADYPLGDGPELIVFGRLADGVTEDKAQLEVELITERLAADQPAVYEHLMGEVVGMAFLFLMEDNFGNADPEILLGQAMMLLLLLIVCGNVGTLILARTATRIGEISIRTALGASRRRIIFQLFVEALVLAVAATGLGLLASEAFARWIMRLVEPFGLLPYWVDLSLTPRSILVALGLAAGSAVVAGVIPAIKATGPAVQANLQRAAAGNSTIRFGWASTLLIVSEVVLSVGFLAMGATMVRSTFQDTEGRLGFEPSRYMQASLSVPWIDPAEHPEYTDEAAFALRLAETQQEVLSHLAANPDVRGVGIGLEMPGSMPPMRRIVLQSESGGESVAQTAVGINTVDIAFFRGLNRPILSGRDFSAADLEADETGHRASVVVNSAFVSAIMGGRNPIGQHFRHASRGDVPPEEYHWYEIVGVVGAFGMNPMNPTRDAGVYYPLAPGHENPVNYLIEVGENPIAFAPHFRAIAAAVDDEATVDLPTAVDDVMKTEGQFFRGMFLMQIALASVAFLLSITGLYALMSFTVSQRTREIGIRTALGARPWAIVSTIAKRAAFQLALGLALGSVWAWILLDEIERDSMSMPFDIPLTIAFTMVGSALIGIAACVAPTLRGLRIQPTEALREF